MARKRKLPKEVIEKFSDIAKDLGNISIVSFVIPLISDKFSFLSILLGLVLALFFWTLSIWLVYRAK